MRINRVVCVMATPLLLACPKTEGPAPTQTVQTQTMATDTANLSPDQAEAARQALVEWFECEECEEGQLQGVVKYGQAVVPLLRTALMEGASPASREILRRELEKRYDELRKYQETHPHAKLGSGKAEFVASNIDNVNAQYQVRAAQALAAIGGEAAVSALQAGAEKAKRTDVQEIIKTALARVKK